LVIGPQPPHQARGFFLGPLGVQRHQPTRAGASGHCHLEPRQSVGFASRREAGNPGAPKGGRSTPSTLKAWGTPSLGRRANPLAPAK
jgi:hypothetical protein